MKILFSITKSSWGGAQSYVYDMASACSRRGWNVIVASGPPEAHASKNNLLGRLEVAGIRTEVIENFTRDISITRELRSFSELLRLIRRERPDIVHVNSSKAAGVGALAARLLRVPTVVFTAHGWPFREERPPLAKSLIWFFSWITALLSDVVIAVSDADARDAAAMPLIRNKVRMIRNGTGERPLLARAEARAFIRTVAGRDIPGNVRWVWTNGELTANKGIGYALQAVRLLKDTGTPVAYVITGSGEDLKALKQSSRDLGIQDEIFFCGFVPDAKIYANAFDIFLLPSLKEGLPYVVLEAGLAGLPVIATNVGGIPEIVENGACGIVVTAKDPRKIADALVALIEDADSARELGEKLRERVRDEFSLDRMVRETIAVYEGR